MKSVRSAALVALLVVACAPTATGPTSSVTPTAKSPSSSQPPPTRIKAVETAYPAGAGAFVIFQLPSESRLRAISFGGDVNGRLQASADQVSARAAWLQSPYGAPFLVKDLVFDRDGRPVGPVAWSSKVSPRWSSKGTSLCAAVPEREVTGSAVRLESLTLGKPARVVATGFATFDDNSVYRVLACDEGTDRAIVAVFGQGVTAARLWVFRLSTGAIVRSVDYTGTAGWVAASTDGSMLAEAVPPTGGATNWKTTIRTAENGAQLATVDDFVARGFSGDNAFVVGNTPTAVAVVDWKAGRKVWTTSGPYGGFLAEPAGRRLAVGLGFVGGSDQRDVYLVAPDGASVLLPDRVRVALLY